MGVVTPIAFPTYPYGFPDEVIDPFMNRTGRGVLGNKPASGTEIIQEFGEEHQQTGKWIVYTSADSVFQIAAHEETIPLEELYDALPHRARDPHRQARRRPRHRAAVRRRARALRAHAEPARLLARAAPPELPDGDPRRRSHDLRRREDLATSSPAATSTSRSRRSRTSRGSTARSSCSRTSTTGFVFANLVETDQLWGHRNDPVNFHRCLQDFDRRLPGHPRRAARRRPPDHHVGPRLRPDDAVDRPLARARAAARLRGGPERGRADPRGRRVRRRRRHGLRLARREASGQGRAGPPIIEP